MKLSVLIVNYNVRYHLEQCLRSVERAIEDLQAEIIVVDNHSHDDSVGYLSPRFPNVTFIDSNHNLGFARANNIAIRQSQGEYVLLLNPDTFVGESVLKRAVTFMDAHPDAGGCGTMMYNTDGTLARESRRGLPTPMVSFKKMLGLDNQYYMSHLPWDQEAQIEVISGAFCLLRRKALDRGGLLDETFFMYGEDIDLSYRLRKGGWQNWYLPLPIVHYKGESTQKTSFRYVHVFYQAMLIFFRKHYGHLSLLITLPIKMAIYLRAFIALVGMLYQRMRHSLGFYDQRKAEPCYEFRGSDQMIAECRELARHKGLSETNGAWRCIVFDTDTYSFEEIIRQMSQMTDHQHVSLGTYSVQTKVLIAPNEIIR